MHDLLPVVQSQVHIPLVVFFLPHMIRHPDNLSPLYEAMHLFLEWFFQSVHSFELIQTRSKP